MTLVVKNQLQIKDLHDLYNNGKEFHQTIKKTTYFLVESLLKQTSKLKFDEYSWICNKNDLKILIDELKNIYG